VLQITQGIQIVSVLSDVLTDVFDRLTRIRIHQPKSHAAQSKLVMQPPNLRRIAVRNRAISPDKNKNYSFGIGGSQRIDLPAR
jgi:hypothetical protein